MLIENAALWLDMGLGKTLVSLAYFLIRHRRDGKNLFLVVCPTTVFTAWAEEAAKHLTKIDHALVIAHGERKATALRALQLGDNKKLTVVVTSYETLPKIADRLIQLPLAGIVFDECSKVKNFNAYRTQAAHALVKQMPNTSVHLLSGTPSSTSVGGFFSLYELLGTGRSGSPNNYAFHTRYITSVRIVKGRVHTGETVFCAVERDSDYDRWLHNHRPPNSSFSYADLGYVWANRPFPPTTPHIRILNSFQKPTGVKNLPALHQITLRNAYVLTKEQVAPELPAKSMTVREVALTDELKAAYRQCREEHHVALQQTRFSFSAMNNPHMKLHQIANGFFYDAQGQVHWFDSQPKIEELLNVLEEAGRQKVVIWSPFRPQIEAVCQALRKEEILHETIHGGVHQNQRQALVKRFRQDPEIRCLVANPDVAGMGLTLVESHLAVVMTNWYKCDVRAQLIDRLHRIGQNHPVTVVDLVSTGTLEPHILNCLRNNRQIEGMVLTGRRLTGATTNDPD